MARELHQMGASMCTSFLPCTLYDISRVLNQHDKRHSRGAQILEKFGTWPSRGQGEMLRPTTPWIKKLNFHGPVFKGASIVFEFWPCAFTPHHIRGEPTWIVIMQPRPEPILVSACCPQLLKQFCCVPLSCRCPLAFPPSPPIDS